MSALLQISDLYKSFRGIVATDRATLTVDKGELHALIGPNGAGKSTLVNQISGEIAPDSGSIVFDGNDITRWKAPKRAQAGLVRSYQITSVFNDMTALENVVMAVQARNRSHFGSWKDTMKDPSLTTPALEALELVDLAGQVDVPAGEMAHGGRRQLELAMAVALQPKLMLLDEPLAGMSQSESESMTRLLGRLKKEVTILLIEHDMQAVFALADRVTVLVAGRPIATGLPDEIRNSQLVKDAYLGEPEELL
ncbi:MAG TPA: ABC transporter ATP-binding protein [Pusillimonas sp.]|uniref:ABC transporter ATP-binding protein n=1 Tax=unclassified Pusillimonas TaxID=2640016 RepID=UPI00260EF5FD|nr:MULTISPECIES: ABC transporter ATP-binding protein [unclassified Pusillimonas]HLU19021.1 ABC transporter ATP-binding protein [Pusillimonas sp.]